MACHFMVVNFLIGIKCKPKRRWRSAHYTGQVIDESTAVKLGFAFGIHWPVFHILKRNLARIVSYDDDPINHMKSNYIKAKGLAGAMIWKYSRPTQYRLRKPPVQPYDAVLDN